MRTTRLVLLLAASRPLSLSAQSPGAIDTLSLRADTYFLAHDALLGRATGSRGTEIAAHFIARRCLRIGLRPLEDSYLHPFGLVRARLLPRTHLVAESPAGRWTFSYPTGLTHGLGGASTLTGFAGPATFVGTADHIERGVLGALDVRGRVAVTIGSLSGGAVDTLTAREVSGIVQLSADADAYDRYVEYRGHDVMFHADSTVRSSFFTALPSVVAAPDVLPIVLAGTRLESGALAPRHLDVSLTLRIEATTDEVTGHNVACMVPGEDPGIRDTAIVLTAHYDHLGIGPPDAAGDSIFNGFSDNAAGVAMLLAIAEAMTRPAVPATRHSVLLLFFTGEERGLLGSDYWVHRPAWPLGRTLAVINLDAGAPPAPPRSWRLAGVDESGLGAVAIEVARSRGWRVTTSSPRANSDYFPFVRMGVPAVFIIPGPDPYEGLSADSSDALRRRWDRYHRASDEWSVDFPFTGLQRYAEYAYRIVLALDAAELQWTPRN